jgi:glycosyltransferase involved in cell wall biosynthesis
MSERPFVSVIVPVFNAASALPRLLNSLRAQEYPRDRFEVLCVDNGSTDGGPAWLGGQGDVRLLWQREWQGPAATRNTGIRAAGGEVLAFIDADCWAARDWLSRGVACLFDRNVDRVAGRVEFVLSRRPNIYELYDSTVNFQQADFIAQGWSGTGNLFVRREVFDQIGVFEPELLSHEDSEWGLRASAAGRSLAYAGDAVVYHGARRSFGSLVRKWMRTEYGAAQVYRRRGLLELQLWNRKANWRPLWGTWRGFPASIRHNGHLCFAYDLLANVLRYAGNAGNFMGYYRVGRRPKG